MGGGERVGRQPAKAGQEQWTEVKVGNFFLMCSFFSPYLCPEKTIFCPFATVRHVSHRPVPTRGGRVTSGWNSGLAGMMGPR